MFLQGYSVIGLKGLVVGYIRVSSKDQSGALVQQRARLVTEGVAKIYEDILSGDNDFRKGYQLLLTDLNLGLISEVVVTRADRLGCNTVEVISKQLFLDNHKGLVTRAEHKKLGELLTSKRLSGASFRAGKALILVNVLAECCSLYL